MEKRIISNAECFDIDFDTPIRKLISIYKVGAKAIIKDIRINAFSISWDVYKNNGGRLTAKKHFELNNTITKKELKRYLK